MNVVEKITEGLSNDDKELLETMVNIHDIHNLRLDRISNEYITEIRDNKVRDLNSKIFGGLSVENNTLVSYFNIEPPARGYFYGKYGGIERNGSSRPIRVELIPKVNEVKFMGKEITEKISWLAKNIEKNLTNLSERNTPICGISELLDKDFSGEYYTAYPITVTADPSSGKFVRWEATGCTLSDTNAETATVTIKGNCEIKAIYE